MYGWIPSTILLSSTCRKQPACLPLLLAPKAEKKKRTDYLVEGNNQGYSNVCHADPGEGRGVDGSGYMTASSAAAEFAGDRK